MTLGVRRIVRAVVLPSVVAVQLGCGSSSLPPVTPTSPGTFANVAGVWTGTLESSNFAARTITLTVVQGGNCVDGAWLSSSSDWAGALSGFADATGYSGQISFERTETGGRCSAIGVVSGNVGSDMLRWTGTGFTQVAGTCADPLPQSLVITLRRQ